MTARRVDEAEESRAVHVGFTCLAGVDLGEQRVGGGTGASEGGPGVASGMSIARTASDKRADPVDRATTPRDGVERSAHASHTDSGIHPIASAPRTPCSRGRDRRTLPGSRRRGAWTRTTTAGAGRAEQDQHRRRRPRRPHRSPARIASAGPARARRRRRGAGGATRVTSSAERAEAGDPKPPGRRIRRSAVRGATTGAVASIVTVIITTPVATRRAEISSTGLGNSKKRRPSTHHTANSRPVKSGIGAGTFGRAAGVSTEPCVRTTHWRFRRFARHNALSAEYRDRPPSRGRARWADRGAPVDVAHEARGPDRAGRARRARGRSGRWMGSGPGSAHGTPDRRRGSGCRPHPGAPRQHRARGNRVVLVPRLGRPDRPQPSHADETAHRPRRACALGRPSGPRGRNDRVGRRSASALDGTAQRAGRDRPAHGRRPRDPRPLRGAEPGGERRARPPGPLRVGRERRPAP